MRCTELTPYEETPRLTDHARERCVQMEISTKVAKRIWQHRTLKRPMCADADGLDTDRVLVTAADYPEYVVVVDEKGWFGQGGPPVIVTVLFNCEGRFVRDEHGGYELVPDVEEAS
jgi:hypothetical protein